MEVQIKELKKGDIFKFNDETYTVSRKWLPDVGNKERPLITKCGQRFYYEGLIVNKL